MKRDIFTVIAVAMLLVSTALLGKAIYDRHNKVQEESTVYIVYTDEESKPYAVITNPNLPTAPSVPLDDDEREQIASIIAGKCGNLPESVQLMVANVVRNDIMYCDGSIEDAVRLFGLGTYRTPTDVQRAVVDAVFERSELSLDDNVLYFNDSDHQSNFHDSLTFVCEYFGISFYKEG